MNGLGRGRKRGIESEEGEGSEPKNTRFRCEGGESLPDSLAIGARKDSNDQNQRRVTAWLDHHSRGGA